LTANRGYIIQAAERHPIVNPAEDDLEDLKKNQSDFRHR